MQDAARFDERVVEDAEALACSTIPRQRRTIILNGRTAASRSRPGADPARQVKRGGELVAMRWAVHHVRSWPGVAGTLDRSRQESRSADEKGGFYVVPIPGIANLMTRGTQPWDMVEAGAVHCRGRGKSAAAHRIGHGEHG